MAEQIQTSIYKLRHSIAEQDKSGKLVQVNIDLQFLENKFLKEGYEVQQIKKNIGVTHELRLFYNTWSTTIKWKEFVADIAEDGEDILENDVSVNEGFILLIAVNLRGKTIIYAITGGFGHIQLQSYIDYQFGLDVLSRLIKTDDKVLRSAKERNFVGGVLGSVKYFRGDYNLNENESFGNYYYELRAKLDKAVLKGVFKFTDAELTRGGLCDAKTSFTIRKPVNFERSIELVEILNGLIKKPAIVDLNLLKRLDKSDKALIEKLEREFDKELYKIYQGKDTDVNVELCNRVFDRYFDATTYHIEFPNGKNNYSEAVEECYNLTVVLGAYKKNHVSRTTQSDFIELLENTQIMSEDGGGVMATFGKLLDHCCAELKFNGRSYFLFNQEWYLVKPDFSKILNRQCQEFITAHSSSVNLQKWNIAAETENDFNAKHIGEINTLVFDKVVPENIEACDILKWTKNEIYFIHVKEGFNNEMRNLGRQVHISARRILQDMKSGRQFLEKLYDELSSKNATTAYFKNAQAALKNYSKKDFLKLFDNRKPVFVVAILDSAKKSKRSFADITKYNSNIAKFCLHQLSQEVRLLDTDLNILEISK